ncbi:MAG: hypothetical protein CMK08_18125 [Ponticaulis sp.]|nr:hypothetical protein [Ponticaulis sp.]|tara:strand:- start:209 stop:517 length:309 start_codon:yes stop_codon:yes gene_type:complete
MIDNVRKQQLFAGQDPLKEFRCLQREPLPLRTMDGPWTMREMPLSLFSLLRREVLFATGANAVTIETPAYIFDTHDLTLCIQRNSHQRRPIRPAALTNRKAQ